ncbi:MAG: hypothetical protein RL338_352 [Chloroflexota bacterium]|jgi:hypothetical protein
MTRGRGQGLVEYAIVVAGISLTTALLLLCFPDEVAGALEAIADLVAGSPTR